MKLFPADEEVREQNEGGVTVSETACALFGFLIGLVVFFAFLFALGRLASCL